MDQQRIQQSHSRSGSADTTRSETSSHHTYHQTYQQMLEHVFTFPGSCEIPLRTMYAINSAVRTQPRPQSSRSGTPQGSAASSPTSPTDPQSITAQFTSALMAQLCSLPTHPSSLPPSFINTFIRRCFDVDLDKVDFTQGLTALDYLKDLEMRRRKDIAATLQRLGVERDSLGTPADTISEKYPCVAAFVKQLEVHDKKAEHFYTQLWIVLRRWVLINEFGSIPFNRNNCVALLNTLYPPVVSTQPSSKLTPVVLTQQREGFFKYINGVSKHGPKALNKLKDMNKRAGEETGWPAVHDMLDIYLRSALFVVEKCAESIYDENLDTSDKSAKRNGRKVDSGVSFGSDRRPSTGSVAGSTRSKQLPLTPPEPKTPRRGGTAFSKIARKFLSSRGKIEVDELVHQDPASKPTLRKMRSTGALGDLKQKNASGVDVAALTMDDAPTFNKTEMQRQRALYEARQGKKASREV